MKNRLFLLILLMTGFFQFVQAQVPGGVCNWDNDKKAAIVLTFDDWSPGHYPIVVPELQSRGLNATFFVTNTTGSYSWPQIITAANNGNEIGNHTKTHPNNLTSTTTALLIDEVNGMKTLIDQNITNQKVTSFAYPFGNSNATVINQVRNSGHIGARGVNTGTYAYNFAPTNNDYYNISTYAMDGTITTAVFNTQITNVIAGGGLLTYLYHSVDNATNQYGDNWFAQVKQTALQAQLDALVAKKNTVWITTFSNALKYHKEKNCATLTQTQAPNGTTWKFNLTDTLANNSVFNQPLSIKLKMNGVNYTSITQNGIAIAIDKVQNDSILFHAVPDGGPIILSTVAAPPVSAGSLTIVDSTFNNGVHTIPVYKVKWMDNKGKPRVALITKPYAADNYPGICVWMQYYDGTTPVVITSKTPSDPEIHNRGFGATVHHYQNYNWYWKSQVNPTFTLRYQGAHHAIFDFSQTIHGAKETVSYTFMDGLDYFQWQETVQCTSATDTLYDSRGPYCTMDWDGNGAFDALDGQQYEAKGVFNQPSYNGAWTHSTTTAQGIPFVNQWKGTREIGYVQTQTFTQQQSGTPANVPNIPASGASVPNNGAPTYFFDYQMNFYDQLQKLTWGMPYGYLEGQAGSGTKSGWGQYSLSIMFDAKTAAGVQRLKTENLAIQNGQVTLAATLGSVVTTGPVGTKNPTLQTLSPVGYDHNYRTWWLQADASKQSQITMNVTSATLVNPTFRIKGMTAVPGIVKFNGTALVSNVDYYASFESSASEVWLTLIKNVTGSNTLLVQESGTINITTATVTPSSVSNNTATTLAFAVSATGTITSVKLNLTAIGGGAAVSMTTAGGNNYTLSYLMAAGVVTGTYAIPVTVTDNLANVQTGSITLTVRSGTTITAGTVNPTSVFNNVVNSLSFGITATDDGTISSVTLDLSSIGGGTAVAMISSGGNNYTATYSMAAGVAVGTKTIVATVTDNSGNKTTKNISLVVNSSVTYLDIYTDASTLVTGNWVATGTLAEQTGMGAIEGTKDYLMTYTVTSFYAGLGLNISNWGAVGQEKNFSTYDNLLISYKGPITSGTGVSVQLVGPGNILSTVVPLTGSAAYNSISIPLTSFGTFDLTKVTEIDFTITGVASGNGTLRLDNIRLSKVTTVVALPTVTSPVLYCQNSVTVPLTATGTSLKWYTVSSGGAASSTAPTPITTTVGTVSYFVSQTISGVESGRSQIDVVVSASVVPSVTIASTLTSICAGTNVTFIATPTNGGTAPTYQWRNNSVNITGATNAVYATAGLISGNSITCVMTSNTNCSSTPTVTSNAIVVTLTTSIVPTVTITSTLTAMCAGTNVTFTATPTNGGTAPTYQWKNNGATISGATASTYSTTALVSGNSITVTMTSNATCLSTSTVASSPVSIVITVGATWYQDVDGDGKGDATQSVVSCTQPVGYVSLSGDGCLNDANKISPGNCGCGETEASCLDCAGVPNGTAFFDNCSVCVGGTTGKTACITTGIISNNALEAIQVAPLPFDQTTNISFIDGSMIKSIVVISADGKIVYSLSNINASEIDLGQDLASGLYTVKVNSDNGVHLIRIIKK